jgi:hypothetical protein
LFHAGTILYFSTLWSIKFSISIFLVRLTKQLGRSYRFALVSLYLICATFAVVILGQVFVCMPLSTVWEGTCSETAANAVYWVGIALNLGTDILLISVPFPALSLITKNRIRIATSIVFGLAGIVVVVSVVRTILIEKVCGGPNLTVALSHIEIMTGIIISALPEVSRSCTRAYINRSGIESLDIEMPADQQRTKQNTDEIFFATVDSRKDGFANQSVESSGDGMDDVEAESANGQHGRSTKQNTWASTNASSTDQISPYPSNGSF